jgi:hypothetical protein
MTAPSNPWTTDELKLLRIVFNSTSKAELTILFGSHTWESIKVNASSMGLRRDVGRKRWLRVAKQHKFTIGNFQTLGNAR